MLSACALTFGQPKDDKQKSLPPRWDSPPEVRILKHRFGPAGKTVYVAPDPLSPRNDPSRNTSIRVTTNPAVALKIKNETTRKIVGLTWYFLLHKTDDEEYFRIRFVNISRIEAGKTKTLMGEWGRMPAEHTVHVDDLNKAAPLFQQRIVISCIMFADGSFSSLNESPKADCESLSTPERNQKP